VDAYLTSLIAKETNSPGHPSLSIGGIPGGPIKDSDLDIGNTIKNDAAAPNLCTISDSKYYLPGSRYVNNTSLECEYITCDSVRGSSPGKMIALTQL
jgi:hypothetical protein